MLNAAPLAGTAAVFARARSQPPAAALQQLGSAVVGRLGYLVLGSFAIHKIHAEDEILDARHPDKCVRIKQTFEDPALSVLGLQISDCGIRRSAPQGAVLSRCLVAFRLGLLARALDQAFHHLEHRTSFGQKLLHHQLVKARFSAANALMNRMNEELLISEQDNLSLPASAMHRAISQQFTQSAKLMGGHGYRSGATHSLEYLSSLIWAASQRNGEVEL